MVLNKILILSSFLNLWVKLCAFYLVTFSFYQVPEYEINTDSFNWTHLLSWNLE